MDCSSVQRLLSPFLKGRLSHREASVVKLHLDSCEECREKCQFFKEEGRAFLDILEPPVPPGIKRRLLDATVHRDTPFSFAALFRARLFWAGAAAVFLVLTVLLAMRLQERPSEPTPSAAAPLFLVQLVDANDTVIVEKRFETREEAEAFITSVANLPVYGERYAPPGYAIRDVSLSGYEGEPF
ncbi:unnamed protein product [marine sediment metagenome]|uniref:Putative zinc-finger domain-containing protein n=1 Tax=marine sediment metagenome TaxID=412755 RepID=X1GJF5_9ZZZZ